MRLSLISLLVVMAWPVSALACREAPPDIQFKNADTVLVGWISSASAPGLEALSPGSRDSDALNQSINSHRIFRIVVTETRKGRPVDNQTVEVNFCGGINNNVGFRVIAYHFPDGLWSVSQLPFQDSSSGP
jgi:hypothetical protein